ncbi:MAG: hypothetical protein QGG40_10360, partial [Myxococcota bacterium]|nr:hypothetical protein [Myxococcota bacterium]
MATRSRQWIIRGLQLAASLAVLAALARDVALEEVTAILRSAAPGWLALTIVVTALGLLSHEARLWLALPRPRPSIARVT